MDRDFKARSNAEFADINGQLISDYHDLAHREVFPLISQPEEGWTAYHIVRALGNYESWMNPSIINYAGINWKMESQAFYGSGAPKDHAHAWVQDMHPILVDPGSGDVEVGDNVLLESLGEYLVKSGQDSLRVTYEQHADGLFASGGGAADNPFITNIAALALAGHIGRLEAGSGSPQDMRAINGAVDIAPVLLAPSDAPASTIGIDLIKLGIKYDLAGRDLDAAKAPPAELVSTFQTIDAFTPDRVLVAAAGGRGTAQGIDAADLYIGGAGASDVNAGAGNDLLYGAAGADELDGGAGNDILLGGDGSDWLVSTAG